MAGAFGRIFAVLTIVVFVGCGVDGKTVEKSAAAPSGGRPVPVAEDVGAPKPNPTPYVPPRPEEMPPPMERELVVNGETVPAAKIVHDAEILFDYIATRKADPTSEDRRNAVRIVLNRWVGLKLCEQFLKREKVEIPMEKAQEYLAERYRVVRELAGVPTLDEALSKIGYSREYMLRQTAVEFAFMDYSQRELLDDVVRERYERSPAQYEFVRLSQIFIQFRKNRTKGEISDKLKSVYDRLRGGEDFGTVASEMSEDPESARVYGDMGWFRREDLPANLAEAAFGLKPREISRPLTAEKGVHVLMLAGRTENFHQSLEIVRNRKAREIQGMVYNQMLNASDVTYGGVVWKPVDRIGLDFGY